MASSPSHARASWHVERATSLSEIWARIAVFSGPVGAWRLTGVCRAARDGAKEHLRSLPGLVVVYEVSKGLSSVWRLDLASLQWESMSALVTAHFRHACCVVRGSVAVVGGGAYVGNSDTEVTMTASMEAISSGEGAVFVSLPPLSYGGIYGEAAIAVEESDSAAGQVLLLGGSDSLSNSLSKVQLVDLATGVCTPQPHLLHPRMYPAAARLPYGRVICAGGIGRVQSAEVWGPPGLGAQDAAWTWNALPAMSRARYGCSGCVMSDGRFAVLGGIAVPSRHGPTSSCEALTFGASTHWEPLPPMHDARTNLHTRRWPDASLSPGDRQTVVVDWMVEWPAHQPKCTTRCWVGGCGFRVIYLTSVEWE
jgi:hypothetical protein